MNLIIQFDAAYSDRKKERERERDTFGTRILERKRGNNFGEGRILLFRTQKRWRKEITGKK